MSIKSIDKKEKLAYDNLENDNQYQINKFIKGAMIMPLAMVLRGETKKITGFRGQEEMKRHLQDLGFIPGEAVRVVGENASGMILIVKGVKIALNKALATKIIVED